MKARQLGTSLVLAMTLAACAGSRPCPQGNVPVLPPQLTFRSATVVGASFEGVEVTVAVDVDNPNLYALPVARFSYAVAVDGAPAFSAVASSDAAVPSGVTHPVTVRLVLPYARIPAMGARLVGQQPVHYAVTGAVGLQTPAGVVELPVGWEGTLPVPLPPTFAFEGVEVGTLSALFLSFDVKVRISNPNAFGLPGGRLGYHLSVSDTAVASGDLDLPSLAPGATAVIAIPCPVNLLGVGASAIKGLTLAFQGSEIPVALEGRATLAGLPVEVKLESRIPRIR